MRRKIQQLPLIAKQNYSKRREKLIADDPRNADAHKNLGNVYVDQGDIEMAVGLYEKFAAYSNDKEDAAKNFLIAGFRYYNKNEYEKRWRSINGLLKSRPIISRLY